MITIYIFMMDMMVRRGLPGIELREFEAKKILHGTIAQFFRKEWYVE
jgi:hypothetical protein